MWYPLKYVSQITVLNSYCIRKKYQVQFVLPPLILLLSKELYQVFAVLPQPLSHSIPKSITAKF